MLTCPCLAAVSYPGESLPFEPRCALHIRRQVLVDNTYGCQTTEPVEITYCMGSCGRSYFIPTMLTTDDTDMQVGCVQGGVAGGTPGG